MGGPHNRRIASALHHTTCARDSWEYEPWDGRKCGAAMLAKQHAFSRVHVEQYEFLQPSRTQGPREADGLREDDKHTWRGGLSAWVWVCERWREKSEARTNRPPLAEKAARNLPFGDRARRTNGCPTSAAATA